MISSIATNPVSPTTGTFTFTINGSGFSSAAALIHVTGPGCTPCIIPNNVLTTKTTSTLSGPATLNLAGTYSFVVQNGFLVSNGSAGPQSGGANVTVTSAIVAPTITSVSPNPVTGSPSSQTITINGTGFVNAPTLLVTWSTGSSTLSGSQVAFVSSTQVRMTITTQNDPDNWTVKVTNPNGGGSSSAFPFAVVAPTPVISSIATNPVSPTTGTFTFTINGSGFSSAAALIHVTGPGCTPCTIPNNVLTAKTTSTLSGPATLNTAGSYSFVVQNGFLVSNGSAGPQSGGANVTVTSAIVAPTITSVSPNPVTGSPSSQTITINGTGFVNAPTLLVTWSTGSSTLSGSQVAFVSSTQLRMTITTQNDPDNWTVKVTNPNGGWSSSAFPFAVVAPTPVISSIATNPVSPTTGTFTFTINGSGFSSAAALIHVTGPGCTPCTIPNNVLTTKTTSTLSGPATLNTAGSYSFVVQNGFLVSNGSAGPQSGGANVTVTSAIVAPTITSVSPNPVTGSPSSQTITINGTGFVNTPTLLVTWSTGSSTLSASQVAFVSSTQLRMTITTQNDPDNWTVKVTNPNGGGSSSAFPFAVVAPTPVISSIATNPVSPTTGTFTFTINGSGFSSAAALIHVTGPGCTPCTIPNNVLTTKTTSTLSGPATLNTAGSYSFVVQNGFLVSNGSAGPQSGGANVTVNPAVPSLPAPSLTAPSGSSVSTTPAFSWTPVTGANKYWLTVATSAGGLPTNVNATSCAGACVISISRTTTSYTPTTALANNTTYYWEVQGYDSTVNPNRQGAFSAQGSFTTIASGGLLSAPAPLSPSLGAIGVSITPGFSWTAVAGANKYWLTVATSASALPTNVNANRLFRLRDQHQSGDHQLHAQHTSDQ